MEAFVASIVSGLLVLLAGFVARGVWERNRSGGLGARLMRRDEYVELVIHASQADGYESLDILAPRLKPRRSSSRIAQLQDVWASKGAQVRLITTNNDESIRAACELSARGSEVRFVPNARIDDEALSFHVFGGPSSRRAILNEKQAGARGLVDSVSQFDGRALTLLLASQFEDLWSSSDSLVDVLVRRSFAHARAFDVVQIRAALNELQAAQMGIEPSVMSELKVRLGVLCRSKNVLIVGLPGSGKSVIRHDLAALLRGRGISCESSSDYGELYREFLKDTLLGDRTGFAPSEDGSFIVRDEAAFNRAFLRSFERVQSSTSEVGISLFEFTRSDLMGYLSQLDDGTRERTQVLYVSTAPETRRHRLDSRRTSPRINLTEANRLEITVGDDHYLPEDARQELYMNDNIGRVAHHSIWRSRVTHIDGASSTGVRRVNLESFIQSFSL